MPIKTKKKTIQRSIQRNKSVKTNFENVRGLVVGDYILFYEIEPKQINIITVWDSRQNPEDLKII